MNIPKTPLYVVCAAAGLALLLATFCGVNVPLILL